MMWQKRLQKQKKSKTKYIFVSDEADILGESINICETVRNLWTYYKCDSQSIFIAVNKNTKTHQIREKSLSLTDINGIKTYKYLNKIITRKEFIIFLDCDKQRETENYKKH